MHAVAHGVDMVEVARIRKMCAKHPDRFVDRCFTAGEQQYCLGRGRESEHLAVRFAAKEAVMKALGTGLSHGIAWTDIEVTKNDLGGPEIALSGQAATVATGNGIARWLVSLSHTDTMAIASVIGLGNDTSVT